MVSLHHSSTSVRRAHNCQVENRTTGQKGTSPNPPPPHHSVLIGLTFTLTDIAGRDAAELEIEVSRALKDKIDCMHQ